MLDDFKKSFVKVKKKKVKEAEKGGKGAEKAAGKGAEQDHLKGSFRELIDRLLDPKVGLTCLLGG